MTTHATSTVTIRQARTDDRDAMLAAIVASGLFDRTTIGDIAPMLDAHLAGATGPGDVWLAIERNGSLAAVASYGPEPLTDGTCNLTLIAVRREVHRAGIGRATLRYVEADLAARGQRLLIVETSGLSTFEATRGFYRACGFDEEVRIRDFFATGDDQIVFRKRLLP